MFIFATFFLFGSPLSSYSREISNSRKNDTNDKKKSFFEIQHVLCFEKKRRKKFRDSSQSQEGFNQEKFVLKCLYINSISKVWGNFEVNS